MSAAQPNKPSTNDTKQKPKSQQAGEITSLFRILKFMSCDPKVSEADFRLAFRIAQAENVGTRIAIIGDDRLIDEMPRTDRSKLRRFRRRMETLGWMSTIEGKRGCGTQYQFLDDNVPAIEATLKKAEAKREEELNLQLIRRKTALQAAALGGRIPPLTHDAPDELREEIYPLKCQSKGGNPSQLRGPNLPPLLPQSSTSQDPLPMEDMTQGEFPTAPSDLWGLCQLLLDDCETCHERDADLVVKFRADGKWRLRSICLECIPGDYAIQCGEADAFKLPGQ